MHTRIVSLIHVDSEGLYFYINISNWWFSVLLEVKIGRMSFCCNIWYLAKHDAKYAFKLHHNEHIKVWT